MIRSALSFPRVAWSHRDLLRSFVWRDLAARYEGSMLGRLLPIVYPAMLLGLYHLVFATFLGLKMGEDNAMPEGWQTTFYLLAGVLPWLAIADSLARSTQVVVENSNLIKKIAFPSELLPVFVSLAQVINLLISMALLVGLYLVVMGTGWSGVPAGEGIAAASHLLYLPVPLVLQLLFCIGLGMILATINVFVRDLSQMVGVFLLLWMLVSPVFYNRDLVERNAVEKDSEWMLSVMDVNPICHLLSMYRSCFPQDFITVGEPGAEIIIWQAAAFPWASCGIFAAFSVALFVVGHWMFVSCKGQFPDEV